MNEYENVRRVVYGDSQDEYGRATFVPVCKGCGRFVKSNETIRIKMETVADEPNAMCSRCGQTQMIFEGFF